MVLRFGEFRPIAIPEVVRPEARRHHAEKACHPPRSSGHRVLRIIA